jgi:PAS domain S-box-containing protein
MKKYKKQILLFLYVSLLIVVASFTFILINFRTQVSLQTSNLTIEKNLIQADSLINNLLQLESDKRGFQLTSDISYLKNVYRIRTGCDRNIINLREKTKWTDDRQLIMRIDTLVRIRLSNMDSGLLLFRTVGAGAAKEFMQQQSRRNTREELVQQLNVLKTSFLTELDKNTRDINIRNFRNTAGIVVVLVIFIMFILVTTSSVRRVQYKFISNHLKFQEAQRIARIGSWEWDFRTGHLKWSHEQFNLFGVDRDTFKPTFENYLSFFMPDERVRINKLVQDTLKRKSSFANEHEVVRIDGTVIVVYEQGALLYDKSGNPCGMFGTTQDITERKRAEEEIRAERKLLRTLIDNIPDPIYIKDTNGKKIVANKVDMEFMGKSCPEEFFGKTDLELFAGQQGWEGHWNDMDVIQSGETVSNRLDEFKAKNGKKYHLLTSKIPLFDSENKPIGLLGISRDISKRVEMENKLIATQKQYQSIFDNTADGIYQSSENGRFLIANNSMARIFGYNSPDELMSAVTDISHQIYADPAERTFLANRLRENGHVEDYEMRVLKKDGTPIWVSANIRVVHDEKGHFHFFEGTLEDISTRKLAEEQLLDLSNRLQVALRATNIGIWDWDTKKDMTVWDAQMFQIYDIIPSQIQSVSASWSAALHPEDRERVLGELEKAIRGEEDFDTEFRIVHRDHSEHYIQANAIVVRDESGKSVRLIGTNMDITARKQAEQEILQLNKNLEQFANITAHDLQEPLRMVSGFLGLLDKRYSATLDEQAMTYISRAKDGADRMTILIRDLLEFCRSGNANAKKEPVDLNYVVDLVYKDMGLVLENESASLLVPNSLPVVVGSSSALYRLFLNLVSNGLKFRKKDVPPEVKLGIREIPEEWEFTVEDNGIGVADKDQPKLFKAFQRLHRKEDYPGTGLGLITCKKIVELHGGRIWMTSVQGEGTSFHFTLPKQRA